MAQIAKIEAKAEIKCDPAKMYDFLKNNKSQFINFFPQLFKRVQQIDGEEGQPGNVAIYEYVIGNTMSVKVKTEDVNEAERSITLVALEGDIMQLYSSFVAKITVNQDSVVWFFQFEKINDFAPNPDIYAKLAVEITKGMDLYFLNH